MPPSIANFCLRTNSRSYSAPKVKLESRVISRVGNTVPLGAIRLAPGDKVWLGVTIPPITSPTSFFPCARAGRDHSVAVMKHPMNHLILFFCAFSLKTVNCDEVTKSFKACIKRRPTRIEFTCKSPLNKFLDCLMKSHNAGFGSTRFAAHRGHEGIRA